MRRFLHLFWIAFLYSCANIVAPTGGPKDETGPMLVDSDPANYQLNFKQKKIRLAFNEYIALKNENEILISPRLESKPSFKLKGKELEIELPDSLGENTTYTINFAKSLVDITEGNAAKNLSYVFSTGAFLDSLSLSGRILSALERDPSADFLIGLYPKDADFETTKPLYLTYTDSQGKFKINNVRKGKFEVLAFEDKNKDLLLSPGEALAFLNESIDLADSIPEIEMRSFLPISRKVVKESAVLDSNTIYIKSSFPLNNPNVNMANGAECFVFNMSADSILVYFNKAVSDTLKFYFSDDEFTDTISLVYENSGKDADSLFFLAKESRILSDSVYQLKLNSKWSVGDMERVRLIVDNRDTLSINSMLINGPFADLSLPIKSLTEYSLHFPDSSLTSINGKFNKSIIYTFKTRNFNEFGSLILDSTSVYKSEHFILELLKKDKLVHREINWKMSKLRINRLEEGDYTLRFIVDQNKNGRFDTGNFSSSTQPEQVLYYNSKIPIKSNWEFELTPFSVLEKID